MVLNSVINSGKIFLRLLYEQNLIFQIDNNIIDKLSCFCLSVSTTKVMCIANLIFKHTSSSWML